VQARSGETAKRPRAENRSSTRRCSCPWSSSRSSRRLGAPSGGNLLDNPPRQIAPAVCGDEGALPALPNVRRAARSDGQVPSARVGTDGAGLLFHGLVSFDPQGHSTWRHLASPGEVAADRLCPAQHPRSDIATRKLKISSVSDGTSPRSRDTSSDMLCSRPLPFKRCLHVSAPDFQRGAITAGDSRARRVTAVTYSRAPTARSGSGSRAVSTDRHVYGRT